MTSDTDGGRTSTDAAAVEPTGPEPSWWRPSNRSARARPPLSRDAIVDAAIRIIDEAGVDALTIRRLGEELGTGAATLYWHISGKEELGELVYDRIMGPIVLPEPDPAQWEEQVKDLARQCYQLLRTHRDAVRLSLGHVPVGPNMLRVMEWTIGLLLDAGLPPKPVGYFGDIFGRYLDASVLEDLEPIGAAEGAADIAKVQAHFAALPVDRFPNLAALAPTMFTAGPEERFEFGLDILVRGLAAHLPADR